MDTLIIRASLGKTLLLLSASLFFVLACAFLIYVSEDGGTAGLWWCVAFFGLVALVFAWQLVRPQILVLNGQGFSLGGGLVRSPKLVPWKDIESFFVVHRRRRIRDMIGYNFAPGVKKSSVMGSVTKSLGAEAALPQGWTLSPEEMVVLLNEYRRRAMAG
ncbi:hypothetical protein NKI32_24240 [Mesorhizobium sp. M0761]|uniref:hypothetical protein n=1 Tax=Mesorhizobium sp. M0761 TaxID=2956994 RepID=UPI00333C6C81